MPEFTAGIHLEKAAGQTYAIHIPHRHTQGEIVPLIMLLHWGGKKYRYIGRDALEQFGFPALSEMQAIIVAPDRRHKHWSLPQAGKDITRLVEYLDEHYNLDHKQRCVVGFSIGGMGVWYLGEEHPDLFTCGVAVAAPVPKHILDSRWSFPVYAIHSELDEAFPDDINVDRIAALQARQAPVELHLIPDASHTDIRRYNPALSQAIPWIEETWAGQ